MTASLDVRIKSSLEAFIRERFDVAPDDPYFSDDVNLWEEGYVDSIGVMEVVAFLEDGFGVKVTEAMLFDPRFTSVAGMADLLAASAQA
jgi:acyl carrier protein